MAVATLASLLAFGCSAPASTDTGSANDSKTAPSGPTGTIRGVVRLNGPAPSAATEKIAQDQTTCGTTVSLPRIELDKSNAIRNTFVYLDGVAAPAGAPSAPSTKSVLVDQKNCQYVPHMMTVPVGSALEITNSDTILHNVHGYLVAQEGRDSLFSISQPIRDQHNKTPELTKPGVVTLTCDAGHPWMNAYVLVAENPYVAISNAQGEFVIPNVPPGTYRIRMWHEGVLLREHNKKLNTYEYEDPYESTQDVVVNANTDTTVNFDLTLRPAK